MVLVALIIGLVVKEGIHWNKKCLSITVHEEAVSMKELACDASIDLNGLDTLRYPIVIHYDRVQVIGKTSTKNHILCPNDSVFSACPQMPDSSQAIHIFPKLKESGSKKILLGLFRKMYYNQKVDYTVTYPVKDSTGFTQSMTFGTIDRTSNQKYWGNTHGSKKWVKEKDEEFFREVENELIHSVMNKMKNKLN